MTTRGMIVLLAAAPLVLLSDQVSGEAARHVDAYLEIGASEFGPGVNSGPAFQGEKTLYVWFWNYNAEQVDFSFTGSLEVVSFVPAPGLANIGTPLSPSVVPTDGPCTTGLAVLLGELVVKDAAGTGGTICLTESLETHRLCFHDCFGYWFRTEYIGYSSDGSPPCSGGSTSLGCASLPVAAANWGSMKARYR